MSQIKEQEKLCLCSYRQCVMRDWNFQGHKSVIFQPTSKNRMFWAQVLPLLLAMRFVVVYNETPLLWVSVYSCAAMETLTLCVPGAGFSPTLFWLIYSCFWCLQVWKACGFISVFVCMWGWLCQVVNWSRYLPTAWAWVPSVAFHGSQISP